MNILQVQNLNYRNILKDISFDLEENTFNVLLGKTGSGKTTIVKCIIGFLQYQGQIIYNNEFINKQNIKTIIKNIGVLTDFNILSDGIVFENFIDKLFNLKYDESKAKKTIYELSNKLKIEKILYKNINELSLSQKKIVSFALSVIHKPKLVIIDDSFEELDNQNRKLIINYLKKMKQCTILLITNNEEDILISDNLIVINDGKIVNIGKTKNLLTDEKTFIKNNVKMPFLVNLSKKLISYELIHDVILDVDCMVNSVWK